MPERKRLQHPSDIGDPLGQSFVNDLTRKLDEVTAEIVDAPRWAGWHYGGAGVPGAALFALFEEDADGREVLTGLMLLADASKGIDAEMLRKVPVTALENSRNLSRSLTDFDAMQDELAKLPPLERGELSGEDFSRLVAAHYRIWASAVPHPAAAMAAQAKTKLPTVHSWIREARLRGFLPPAKGRR